MTIVVFLCLCFNATFVTTLWQKVRFLLEGSALHLFDPHTASRQGDFHTSIEDCKAIIFI